MHIVNSEGTKPIAVKAITFALPSICLDLIEKLKKGPYNSINAVTPRR